MAVKVPDILRVDRVVRDPVGYVEGVIGVGKGKQDLKDAAGEAVDDAGKAGDDAVTRLGDQRQRNENTFFPPTVAVGDIKANAPERSSNISEELENERDNPSETSKVVGQQPAPTIVQDYNSERPEIRNRSGEFDDGFDPNDKSETSEFITDHAKGLIDDPLPETRVGSRIPDLDDFSDDTGEVGERLETREGTDIAEPLKTRGEQAAGQEDAGFSKAAFYRAAGSRGREFGAGQGLTALYGAQVDPYSGQYLGDDRAEFLRNFDQAEGFTERELRERREGGGQYGELLGELTRELNRQGAARGGFNSGNQLRLIESGASKLAREELDARAELAGSAQSLRQERARDVTAGLGMAEKFATDRQGINADIAGNIGTVSTAIDSNVNRGNEIFAEVAGATEEQILKARERTDFLISQGVEAELAEELAKDELAKSVEQTKTERTRDATDAAGLTDGIDLERETSRGERALGVLTDEAGRELEREELKLEAGKAGDNTELAKGELELETNVAASGEALEGRDQDISAAQFMDEYGVDRDRLRLDAAGQSDEIQRQILTDTAKLLTEIGISKAELDQELTLAQTQAELDTAMAAIDVKLAAAGIDLQTRTAMINNIITGLGAVLGGGG